MAQPDVLLNLARKMSSDPAIQRQIAESFFRLTTSNPQLGRRLLEGDPQAVMEAYQTLIRNNGSIPMPSGPTLLGARPIGPGEAVGGVSGPGVAVPQSTAMIPAPPRGLPHDPSATRALTTAGGAAPDSLESAARPIVIDATPPADDAFQLGDDLEEAGNIVIDMGEAARPSRIDAPLAPENPFTPAVSARPRLGYSPVGPGVPVGGPAGGPRAMVPVGRKPPEVPGWVPPAATAALAAGLGGAIYMGTRPGETAAPNVDATLAAAATEIAPDEEVGAPASRTWRDMSDEEMVANLPQGDVPGGGVGVRRGDLEAYGRRYRQAVHNTIDRGVEARQAARRAGYSDIPVPADEAMGTTLSTDNRSAYGPMHTFAPGATVVVDGVRVPAVDLGDGNLRYRLGDVKRAQEAEKEARLAAMFSQSAQEDLARYGDRQTFRYKRDDDGELMTTEDGKLIPEEIPTEELKGPDGRPDPALAAKQENVKKRRGMESRQVSQNAALRARAAGRSDAMMARNSERFADMARLAGGSQGLRGGAGGNIGMFQAIAMLAGRDPNNLDAREQAIAQNLPMDPVRAQVEGRRWDMAGRLAGDVVTGALAGQGQGGVQERAFLAEQANRAQDFFDQWHDRTFGWGTAYTKDSRDQAVRILMNRFQLDYGTAAAIADSRPSAGGGQPPAAGALPPGSRSPATTAAGNPRPITDGFDR